MVFGLGWAGGCVARHLDTAVHRELLGQGTAAEQRYRPRLGEPSVIPT